MRPRALHLVVPGDLDTKTGGYGYDRHIVEGLRQRGWAVEVVALNGGFPEPSSSDRAQAARAFAALPDDACVLVDGLALGALPDEALAEGDRLRLVALVHHPLGLETGLADAIAHRLLASEARALRAARGVVVTSHRTVAAVERLSVPRSRIAVVEPGTESRPAAEGSGVARVNLLCVASITPRKAHDTLLDAMERLNDLEWHLWCVGGAHGSRAYADGIRDRTKSGRLADRVSFPGELSGPSLDDAYHRAALFVLPTRYEGYGMAVAEALARGIPVVSTPTGAIPELVGDMAGFLVAPDDPAALAGVIRLFMTDRMVRTRMRQGALRVRARLPGWDAAAARMEQALDHFVA
jgi:glycosyltransferase involved in cell wall biosynthesis